MLGLDNAGKTTFLKRLNGEDTAEVAPTLGFNICSFAHGQFGLSFWDVGGQKSLRAFWRNYFEETDGLIWVVDSADQARLQVEKETTKKQKCYNLFKNSSLRRVLTSLLSLLLQRDCRLHRCWCLPTKEIWTRHSPWKNWQRSCD